MPPCGRAGVGHRFICVSEKPCEGGAGCCVPCKCAFASQTGACTHTTGVRVHENRRTSYCSGPRSATPVPRNPSPTDTRSAWIPPTLRCGGQPLLRPRTWPSLMHGQCPACYGVCYSLHGGAMQLPKLSSFALLPLAWTFTACRASKNARRQ